MSDRSLSGTPVGDCQTPFGSNLGRGNAHHWGDVTGRYFGAACTNDEVYRDAGAGRRAFGCRSRSLWEGYPQADAWDLRTVLEGVRFPPASAFGSSRRQGCDTVRDSGQRRVPAVDSTPLGRRLQPTLD